MSNHVHLVISRTGAHSLFDILRDLKKFTAQSILKDLEQNTSESRRSWMLQVFREAGKQNSNNTKYQFWRQDNQPKELSTPAMIEQKIEYLNMNPVVEGIVDTPEAYVYSSAYGQAGKSGLLELAPI